MESEEYTPDQKYLIATLGPALREGLVATVLRKPADPIEYLARFLRHFEEMKKLQESDEVSYLS